MTVEPSTLYRTVVLTDLALEERSGVIFSGDLALVPDTRLQAIADKWIDIQIFGINHPASERIWDKLTVLLDALNEEVGDE